MRDLEILYNQRYSIYLGLKIALSNVVIKAYKSKYLTIVVLVIAFANFLYPCRLSSYNYSAFRVIYFELDSRLFYCNTKIVRSTINLMIVSLKKLV